MRLSTRTAHPFPPTTHPNYQPNKHEQEDDDDVTALGGGGERARAAGQVRTLLGEVEGEEAEPAKGCVRTYVNLCLSFGLVRGWGGKGVFLYCVHARAWVCVCVCVPIQAWWVN